MRVCQFRHFGSKSGVHNTVETWPVKGTATGRSPPTRAHVTFKDAFATVRNNEAWLVGCHINPYSHGTDANHDPERDRKLLLHRREIGRLTGKIAERGLTLIPLRLYFKGGRAKLEIGLARGKKLHDKRSALRERETRREMDKAVRSSRKGDW